MLAPLEDPIMKDFVGNLDRINELAEKSEGFVWRLKGDEDNATAVRIFEDDRVEVIIIEINSLPGMTPATCIYHQAAINGYKPFEFIDKILTFGRERNQQASVE